ncbi:hypothetical protein Dimus_027790 [Dionaea muscipula]
MDLKETELTLGLPGNSRDTAASAAEGKSGVKRGFSETLDLLNLSGSSSNIASANDDQLEASSPPEPTASKAQLVGWPPVRASRKNAMRSCGGGGGRGRGNFVKVAAEGAPFLRKVDLETYGSYEELFKALEEMFSHSYGPSSSSSSSGSDYVHTYEDKDGDWMLVGDVPWKLFAGSCKKVRLMKNADAVGLAPRTPTKV